MPQNIDKTLKVMFSDTIKELPQQTTDRLAGRVLETSFGGAHQEFDTGNQSDGHQFDYDIDKKVYKFIYLQPSLIVRREKRKKFIWSNGFSLDDQTRLNKDTMAHYSRVAMYSFNRFKTEFTLVGAWAQVESGSTAKVFSAGDLPDANTYVISNAGNTALAKLNLDTLIRAKSFFTVQEVGLDEYTAGPENLTCALAPGNLQDLLNISEIRNSDTNTIKALVRGEVDSYMGFKFIYTGVARSHRRVNPIYNTASKQLDVSKASNDAAGAGQTKLNLSGEYVAFFHTDGLCRGPVAGTDAQEVGSDHELYGDKYMYLRRMLGRLRHIDQCVFLAITAVTDGGAYKVAPSEDAEFKDPNAVASN